MKIPESDSLKTKLKGTVYTGFGKKEKTIQGGKQMSKKILSMVMALVLVASVFSICAVAGAGSIGYEDESSTYSQTWGLSDPVDNGDGTWSVDVTLETDYTVGSIQFEVANTNNTGVALTNVAIGSGLTALYYEAPVFSNDNGYVAIIANPDNQDGDKGSVLAAGSVIATLTYTVTDGESATINIVNDPKSKSNAGGTLIAIRLDQETFNSSTPYVGQIVNGVGDAQVIGAAPAAPADLAVKATAASQGVVIDTAKTFGGLYNGVVYGFKQAAGTTFSASSGAYLTNSLEVTNGGSWEVSRTIGSSGFGTGTVLTIKNADGSDAGKKYVIVIFGDVDGNGNINSNDTGAILKGTKRTTPITAKTPQRMAANLYIGNATVMNTVASNDVDESLRATKRGYYIDQAAVAAGHVANGASNYGA